MKPRISVITIGVTDLEKSLVFYRDGLDLSGGNRRPRIRTRRRRLLRTFGRLKLGIWAQDDIAHDTCLPKTAISPTSFTIGHNVVRREEVDAVIEQARQAGADIVKPPEDTFYGGYAGYFRDPNGHLGNGVESGEHPGR